MKVMSLSTATLDGTCDSDDSDLDNPLLRLPVASGSILKAASTELILNTGRSGSMPVMVPSGGSGASTTFEVRALFGAYRNRQSKGSLALPGMDPQLELVTLRDFRSLNDKL